MNEERSSRLIDEKYDDALLPACITHLPRSIAPTAKGEKFKENLDMCDDGQQH